MAGFWAATTVDVLAAVPPEMTAETRDKPFAGSRSPEERQRPGGV
jgi:hypothetical protein